MPDFSESQVFEALGIEPGNPAGGANEQEPAAPATKETDQPGSEEGANEREPAAPATDTGTAAQKDDSLTDTPGEPSDGGDGKPPMTDEERKEAAAQRRRQERQAAIDEAVAKATQAEREKHQGELTAFFQAAQLKNTFTGKPITSMEEFQEWKQAFDAAQFQKDLKAGKLTPEALGRAISETPAMQKVQEIIDREEKAKEEQDTAAARQRIAADMAEIQKLDPSVKSLEDILKMPTAKEFYTYVTKNHLSYLDAFRLANQSGLEQRASEAARASALGKARSKDHMTATKAQGPGAVAVPSDEAELFRLMNPGATDAEIQDYYNKHKRP